MQEGMLELANRLCRQRFGADCRLEVLEELVAADWGRSTVWRCSLTGRSSAPPTLIAKISNLGEGHGRQEAAVLPLLRRDLLPEISMPEFIAADPDCSLLLLSDLGELRWQRLADLRSDMSPDQLLAILDRLMQALGRFNRLHPASRLQDAADWQQLQATDCTGHSAMRMEASLSRFPEHFASLGLVLGDAALAELEQVRELLAVPAWQCLTHADICPSNVALVGDALYIYDFEVASLRHPAIDAAWPRMRSLRCMDCTQLSAAEISRLEQQWLRGFGPEDLTLRCGCENGMLFGAGCLAWLSALLDWLPAAMQESRNLHGVTDRSRILLGLQAMQDCSREHGCLPGTADCCQSLETQLALRWQAQ
ncbi:phosphotransferase [bacterium]|nr:phosphotransferase [bacterium]